MKVKEKICIKFSIGLLFRKVENFPAWDQIIDAHRGLQKKRKGSVLNGNWLGVLNFCHQCVIHSSFLQGFLLACSQKVLWDFLSDGLLTSFYFRTEFTAFPHRNLYKPSTEQFAQLYQPCGSLQDVSKQHWGKTFHTFQSLSLYLLYKANILCTPQTFGWTMQEAWHQHISIIQNPHRFSLSQGQE